MKKASDLGKRMRCYLLSARPRPAINGHRRGAAPSTCPGSSTGTRMLICRWCEQVRNNHSTRPGMSYPGRTLSRMALAGITRGDVLKAIAECQERGQEEFLGCYGFGQARQYLIVHEDAF